MESPLASWQLEIFSNPAEFSPPISPSPLSPTLYSYSNAHQVNPAHCYIKTEGGSSPFSTRAQLASSILHDLEFENFQYSQHASSSGMEWSEESVNLELFEDLDEFDFSTRPLTPDSQEFKNQEQLQQIDESPQPSPSHEFPTDSYGELSAEFQNILAGLSAQVTNIDNGEVIEIIGIPVSIEELQTEYLNFPPADESGQGSESNDDDDDTGSSDGNSMDMDDGSHTFDDVELQLVGLNGTEASQSENSFNFSASSSPTSSISDEEIDETDDACHGILDALLEGDLITAKSYIPLTKGGPHYVIVNSSLAASPSASQEVRASSSNQKRGKQFSEFLNPKNGRSGSGLKKPRLSSSTDKVQRKKEQNKTAATRYREKKKLQAAIVTVQEDGLERINDELKLKRNDLHRQVLIYKELLRAVMMDRKVKKESSLMTVSRGNRGLKM